MESGMVLGVLIIAGWYISGVVSALYWDTKAWWYVGPWYERSILCFALFLGLWGGPFNFVLGWLFYGGDDGWGPFR